MTHYYTYYFDDLKILFLLDHNVITNTHNMMLMYLRIITVILNNTYASLYNK